MSIRIEMSLNLSNLTDTAQKNLSIISRKISIQRGIIDKERAVLDTKGDTYVCSRARNACQIKKEKLDGLEQEFEKKRRHLENEIEIQEQIIWNETHRESPSIIRAKAEIDILTKEKNKILKATGVFETPVEPTPVPVAQPQEISDESLDFAMFMRDGRQDGQEIDPNPSYLNSVSLGTCMTKLEKKKGIRMP